MSEIIEIDSGSESQEQDETYSAHSSDLEHERRSEGDLRTKIWKTLQKIKTPNAFAFSAINSSLPNPGLHLSHHGLVSLPLSTCDALKIISLACPSPFGRGEKTMVDDTVRRCWELKPNQFSIKNPAWSNAMKEILKAVSIGLGIRMGTGKVVAEINKLLLYESGAFFKPHKDSEKSPGMFATLVVCLPSPHEGGKLVLTHDNEKYEFETAMSSTFDTSYAAWYSDITHEVLPVISGYRLMLTYNLIRSTDFVIPPYDVVRGLAQQLLTQLQQYNLQLKEENSQLPPILLHKLKHQYTQTNLKLNLLKPQDLAQVQTLTQVSTHLGFDIYLATLKLTVRKNDDYDDFAEKRQSLENMVELDSNFVVKSFNCPDGALIDPTPQDTREADEEEHEGPTGNEGSPATYWYRDTVVVLVPSLKQLDFIFQFSSRGNVIEPLFSRLVQKFSEDPSHKPELEQLCELALKQEWYCNEYSETVPPFFQQATATVLDLGRFELFDEACKKTNDKVMLMLDIPRILGRWVANKNLATMEDQLMKGVYIAPSVAEKLKFLESVAEGFKAALQEHDSAERINLKQWSDKALFSAVSQLETISKADSMSLGHLHKFMDWSLFEMETMPVIFKEATVVKMTFVNEFMSSLQQELSEEQRTFIESIVQNIWREFDIVSMQNRRIISEVSRRLLLMGWRNELYKEELNESDLQNFVKNTITILSPKFFETTIVPAMLTPIPKVSKECAKDLFTSLINMILSNDRCKNMDWILLKSNSLPILSKVSTFVKVIFVNMLMSALQQELVKELQSFIESIIHNIWNEFDFNSMYQGSVNKGMPQKNPLSDKGNVIRTNVIEQSELKKFMENTITILWPEYIETNVIPAMLRAIPDATRMCSKELFVSLVCMILKNELAGFRLPSDIAVPPLSHKCLVQALLKKYLIENVGCEPQKPTNWALPAGRCNCNDCAVVNRFLQDPMKKRLDFPCVEQRRRHLYANFTNQYRTRDCEIARGEDYDVGTVRTGRPFVWQITKHLGGYEVRKASWLKKTETAKKTLSILKQDEPVKVRLETYLQPFYDSIMMANVGALPNSKSLITLPKSLEASQLVLPPLNNLTNQPGHKREGSQVEALEEESAKRPKAEVDIAQ